MSDFLPLPNISGNSMVSFGTLFSNNKSNTTFFYQANLSEWDKEKKELKEDYKEKCLELAPKFSKPY